MPLLLFHAELHSGLKLKADGSPRHFGGEVITVERDGHVFSEMECRQFGVADVEGDFGALRAMDKGF